MNPHLHEAVRKPGAAHGVQHGEDGVVVVVRQSVPHNETTTPRHATLLFVSVADTTARRQRP